MLATFKEHGPRWLVLIFLLIMLGALAVSTRFLVEDTARLSGKVDGLVQSQQLLQSSLLATNEKVLSLQAQVVEQKKLVEELEKIVNHALDQ